jgi:hypothetical protein
MPKSTNDAVAGEVSFAGSVLDCGCIALPEELQQKSGLYPGAKFKWRLHPDGSLVIIPLTRVAESAASPGVQCQVDPVARNPRV